MYIPMIKIKNDKLMHLPAMIQSTNEFKVVFFLFAWTVLSWYLIKIK
jgi:hypothetical protein